MVEEYTRSRSRFWSFLCCRKPNSSRGITATDHSLHKALLEKSENDSVSRKPRWKAAAYILGNEAIERLATLGMTANLMVYLMKEYDMEQMTAANIINVWYGATNVFPLIGAFIADAYVGKYLTVVLASFATLLGMTMITITASIPGLRPPKCDGGTIQLDQCAGYTQPQLLFLLAGLYWLSIGTGGIRPCTIPFAVDQFDTTTDEGRKGTNSLYNWFYTIFTVVLLIDQTVVVYIQDSVSWALGFGIPTVLMFFSILLFVAGSNSYVYEKPQGSIFSGILQVFVVAFKNRHRKVPSTGAEFYDPPLKEDEVEKLPLSAQLRCFNKAALIVDNNQKPDGPNPNPWRLRSIQHVEEVKCIVKIIPIWASGIICYVAMTQQATFAVSQALKMDRHVGHINFQIPAGSLQVISYITIGIWLPLYDSVLLPILRKITKNDDGLTTLQRIGIGNVFSVLCMVVAGLVERERRAIAISSPRPDGVAPLSVLWLAPQLIFLGFLEVFTIVGLSEFYNKEFPHNMRSIGYSLLYLSIAGASYLSSLLVNIVHNTTGKNGRPDWLTNDINTGRLEYFYFLIAGLGALNFVYFLFCARGYKYKVTVRVKTDHCSVIHEDQV